MPESIISKLNTELNKVITNPDFIEKFRGEALTSMPMTPNQFSNYIAEDIARWTKVAREKKIEIDQ
jgi:tripartite-type tricarboxylate transporter receptor subunit TctC